MQPLLSNFKKKFRGGWVHFWGGWGCPTPKKIAYNHHRTRRYIPWRVESNQLRDGEADRRTVRHHSTLSCRLMISNENCERNLLPHTKKKFLKPNINSTFGGSIIDVICFVLTFIAFIFWLQDASLPKISRKMTMLNLQQTRSTRFVTNNGARCPHFVRNVRFFNFKKLDFYK